MQRRRTPSNVLWLFVVYLEALGLVVKAFPTKTPSWRFSVSLRATLFALMIVIRDKNFQTPAKLKIIILSWIQTYLDLKGDS